MKKLKTLKLSNEDKVIIRKYLRRYYKSLHFEDNKKKTNKYAKRLKEIGFEKVLSYAVQCNKEKNSMFNLWLDMIALTGEL